MVAGTHQRLGMPSTGWATSASGTLSIRQSYTSGTPAWCGTLSPVEALPCGSRSTTRTRLPCSARATARFTVVVVLPTPPFWFATQSTLGWSGRGMVISPLGLRICTARNASMASGGSSSSEPGVSRETCSSGANGEPAGDPGTLEAGGAPSETGTEVPAADAAEPDTGAAPPETGAAASEAGAAPPETGEDDTGESDTGGSDRGGDTGADEVGAVDTGTGDDATAGDAERGAGAGRDEPSEPGWG